MNPFDLAGPQFLVFYSILGVAVNVILRSYVRGLARDRHVSLAALAADPYQIAYLRGSTEEAIRLAIVALVDRRLLSFEATQLRAVDAEAPQSVRRELERAILVACARPRRVDDVLRSPQVRAVCDIYRDSLVREGLLGSESVRAVRARAVLIAVTVLVAVAGMKVGLALSRGRVNIGFLLLLTVVFAVAALVMLKGRRTALGQKSLQSLQTLFARLKRRADVIRPGGLTNEAVLLAAVFGLGALPSVAFSFVAQLFPAQASRSSSSSCGAGDTSGCGGSGGGGCGGCGGGGD